MPKHLTRAELDAGLPEILAAPADNGMLRCVILYRQRFDSGVTYQGVAMFEAHSHLRTQNMYTKDGSNC